jgi:hypothetical protein
MNIRFSGKKLKLGHSYGVIIPKSIAELLEKDKKYCFSIKEEDNVTDLQTDIR